MGQYDPGRWSQHGPDYDAFDLVATINLAYDDTTDSVYPLLFEGIGPTDLPPVGFLVVDPFNYHMGLDWLNIVNDSTDPATVSVRIYLYSGDPLAPYGTAGPVVWSEILAAGTSTSIDMSRFRLSIGPGQFFVVLAEGGTIGTLSPVQVQARGRFTPG